MNITRTLDQLKIFLLTGGDDIPRPFLYRRILRLWVARAIAQEDAFLNGLSDYGIIQAANEYEVNVFCSNIYN